MTFYWKVTGSGRRDGEKEQLSFTVSTDSKDDVAAADEFCNLVDDIGLKNPRADDVRLLGRG